MRIYFLILSIWYALCNHSCLLGSKVRTDQLSCVPYNESAVGPVNIIPVLIIGSGVAGLCAALYTARDQIPTTVLTGQQPGGQLAYAQYIENWPGKERQTGAEAIADLIKQVQSFGAVLVDDTVTHIDTTRWPFTVHTQSNKKLFALSIIAALGRLPYGFAVANIDQYWGYCVGTCTLCDGPLYRGRTVAVVGATYAACSQALQLAHYAHTVYLLVPEDALSVCAAIHDTIRAAHNITIMYNAVLKELEGLNHILHAAIVHNLKTDQVVRIPVDGLYFAHAHRPNSDLLAHLLPLDAAGFVRMVDTSQRTHIPGLFVAGDLCDARYGKAGVALASGIKAGIDTLEFLNQIGYGSYNNQWSLSIGYQQYQALNQSPFFIQHR